MSVFYRLLLAWTRFDLAIARSAPVINIAHLEQLRRDESDYERALIRLQLCL